MLMLLVTRPAPKPLLRLLLLLLLLLLLPSPITARSPLPPQPPSPQQLHPQHQPTAPLSLPPPPPSPATTTASYAIHRPRTLSSRAAEEGPYTDIPLVPLCTANSPAASSLQPPERAYQPPPRRPANIPPFHERRSSQGRSLFSTVRTSIRKPPSSRLWNPINYVPRTTIVTAPRPAPVSDTSPYIDAQRDAYPLLTIPEQRRSRQPPSPTSLLVERSVADTESGRASIGLPPGHRRSGVWENSNMGKDSKQSGTQGQRDADHKTIRRPDPALVRTLDLPTQDPIKPPSHSGAHHDHPRHVPSQQSLRSQTFASFPSGNGNHSSGGSGIGGGGAEGDVADELAWGPSHPCFPHMNPHVPITSPEYQNTRIIRIRRDWMVKGDLAPTFSNLYPEILDPLLPEQEFRTVIAKVNAELIATFDPYSARNWFDGTMGLVTGWVWDDLGLTGVKGRLDSIEKWIENWNQTVGVEEGVKIWSLRSTGYLSVDIQIPDPKVGIVESDGPFATDIAADTAGGNTAQQQHHLQPES
ncbi:uncharacterized protein PADG_05802 [Paracoccidioides brasiliensis Pb18]|uniref:Ras modification protein ERF4 n=1 Tax=Paracoccidioides brasiliensis (strain Pb18) TaxID=502780 RepID=C1GEW6_PARBD|nr:uncharacterized protein PADG_05802 [Paracoccidioides brasiliensis Pb18]EEH49723.1 hypothetical protein PADG_05802 [Paracoccidioides brasiliensis Pb18]